MLFLEQILPPHGSEWPACICSDSPSDEISEDSTIHWDWILLLEKCIGNRSILQGCGMVLSEQTVQSEADTVDLERHGVLRVSRVPSSTRVQLVERH